MSNRDRALYQRMFRGFRTQATLRLAATPIVGFRSFREEEVRSLERSLGLRLPEAYRAFLTTMGRSAGDLFQDVTITFRETGDLLRLQDRARSEISEAGRPTTIPPRAYFFDHYLDSQFGFFVCDEDDEDPLTYNFEFGNPELDPPVPVVRFTDVIRTALDEYRGPRKSFG
ncbi:SMI1/KNR4 family protein [Planctomyces sp. SH-PL62]|uniref:SMI1/KNR4 family protein n=1 Tax=Planctomyces sp. SH-PL62 TaxID=1636152 RepID=UPI00078BCB6D|nr:SMI1/KNR4 family protein [Planctomyces sp. SH-PL62]AMV40814.1 hypothetical protein VT85_25500 [Planctomyces sp. SH-PL62]